MSTNISTLLNHIVLAYESAVEHSQQEIMQGYRTRYTPLLNALYKMNNCTVKELSTFLNLTQPAITQTLKLMVKAELVLMTKDKEDSRIRRLCLSKKGENLLPLIAEKTRCIHLAVDSLEDDIGFPLIDALTLIRDAITEKTFDDRIYDAEQKCGSSKT